jgi:SAM-dependent methyltransferase
LSAPHLLFDRKLLKAHEARALKTGGERFLFDRVTEELTARLSAVTRRLEKALDIGTPDPASFLENLASAQIGLVDRAEVDLETETVLAPSQNYDLAVSALAMQWFNDLPGVLAQAKRLLKPDGLLLAALIGGDTLTELRESLAAAELELEGGASPRVSPFVEVRTLGALLQRAGFALPVTDADRFTVRYATALELMRDLRRMGATNVLVERSRKPLRRQTLLRTVEIYSERFADPDGRVRATFEILWMSGWVPHESQQQPLRPGSAKARLADALRAIEIPAGDKAGPKKN